MVRLDERKYGVTLRRSRPLRLDPHSEAPDERDWHQWVLDSTKPIAVDLFCGAGGLSCGLEAAGYRVALAVDTDDWALESHRHNVGGRALRLDLAEPRMRQEIAALLEGIDVGLVAGGPPCQPFSRAGRSKIRSLVAQGARSGDDQRRELWRAFLELVEAIRPRAVLMENVPDMALGDDFTVVRTMIECLTAAGYETDARIVDAWRHGVPQHRQRLILVALRDGAVFEWPAESPQVTVYDAISDLPHIQVLSDTALGAPTMRYEPPTKHDAVAATDKVNANDSAEIVGPNSGGELLTAFAQRARQFCVGEDACVVYDHTTRSVRADDLEAFKLMDSNTLYSELPAALRRYRDDIFNDKYNRLNWSGRSRTITAHMAKDGYWYIHPEQHRTLTVREAARIQTFPDSFRFAGCRSHQFQQIGNAVPPALAQAIGSAILESQKHQPRHQSSPAPLSEKRTKIREAIRHWARLDYNAQQKIDSLTDDSEHQPRTESQSHTRSQGAMKISAPALRVAARVSGIQTDTPPHKSVARMELAKLAGLGNDVTNLNVAIHALGCLICRPKEPMCHRCPLSNTCSFVASI